LPVAAGNAFNAVNSLLPETDKSFLVLFFKKELLSLSPNLSQCGH